MVPQRKAQQNSFALSVKQHVVPIAQQTVFGSSAARPQTEEKGDVRTEPLRGSVIRQAPRSVKQDEHGMRPAKGASHLPSPVPPTCPCLLLLEPATFATPLRIDYL